MTTRLPERPPEAPPELTTTRVDSGPSARFVAVAVASVLIAVVGFVLVSRPPASTVPTPSAVAIALVPTSAPTDAPSASPEPSHHLLDGDDGVLAGNGIRGVHRHAPLADPLAYEYAVSTLIPGGRLRVALNPRGHGLYLKELVIDTVDLAQSLELDVDRGWTQLGVTTFETMDRWPIGLQPLLDSQGVTISLLSASAPNGYTFTVTGRRMRRNVTLVVELVFPSTR